MLNYIDIKDDLVSYLSAQKEDPIFIDCGEIPYAEALELQLKLQKERTENSIPNVYLLLEHPPVITMGARKADNKLLSTPGEMLQQGIHLEQIRRGGGATSHNPGQLVVYPIINLRSLGCLVPSHQYHPTDAFAKVDRRTQIHVTVNPANASWAMASSAGCSHFSWWNRGETPNEWALGAQRG